VQKRKIVPGKLQNTFRLKRKSMFDVLVVLDYGTALNLPTFRRLFNHYLQYRY